MNEMRNYACTRIKLHTITVYDMNCCDYTSTVVGYAQHTECGISTSYRLYFKFPSKEFDEYWTFSGFRKKPKTTQNFSEYSGIRMPMQNWGYYTHSNTKSYIKINTKCKWIKLLEQLGTNKCEHIICGP